MLHCFPGVDDIGRRKRIKSLFLLNLRGGNRNVNLSSPSPSAQLPPIRVPTFRFSTQTVPKRERVAAWYDVLGRQAVRLDAQPLSEHHRVDGVVLGLPSLPIVAANTTPARIGRTRQLVGDGNDNLRFIVARKSANTSIAAQRERETTVEPGGAVLLSNAAPNSIIFPSSVRLFVLHLNPMALRPLLRDFDTAFARAISKRAEALKLLSNYIGWLYAQPLASPELQQVAVAHVYDLAALAIGATRDATEMAKNRGLRAARMSAIKADIRANLACEALSINEIALRQRVTPRYIQKLFEGEDTTFTEFVLNERLMRAHRMLTDLRFVDRLIGAIAFDVGFGDLSYFNNSFRRRFGRTPSDVRAEVLQGFDARSQELTALRNPV
jgi:AraC-like DNA-binding protein